LLPYNKEWYDNTVALLDRAIQIDPEYARARQEYAWVKLMGWIFRFEKGALPPEEIRQNAIKAIQLDPDDALAHRTAAYGYFFDRRLDLFEQEAQRAFELAPYNADVFAQLGMAISFTGQWDRGVSLVKKAYQLNPASAGGWYHTTLHYNHYRMREYRQALEAARRIGAQTLCETQWKYVAAYGQLGEPQDAKEHWERCVAAVPHFSPDRMANLLRIWNFHEPFITHYMEGIAKAGYPCRTDECGFAQ
jgi:tetratricopeptide (TPR) repeat protein